MPNVSLNYADRPDTIRIEGQNITLTFSRTGPTTGVLTWNIPAPANGCDSGTRAYNGIVLTGSTAPANPSTSPVNGQFYKSDPTMDGDAFAGDQVNGAFIVGSFYNDTTTTAMSVSGLDPQTVYYFSAYAVNSVLDYDRGGVHAYTTKLTDYDKYAKTGTPAIAGVMTGPIDLVNAGKTQTGLALGQNYSVRVTLNNTPYTLTIQGALAQNWADLVTQLNQAADKQIGNVFVHPQAPNTGTLYFDGAKLWKWSGAAYAEMTSFINLAAGMPTPNAPTAGVSWFNTQTSKLHVYDGAAWALTPFIEFSADPSQPQCDMYWFDGQVVRVHDGKTWKPVQTFVQATNPFVPAVDSCDTYWYDESTYILKRRTSDSWVAATAIYSSVDPHSAPDGWGWFAPTTSTLKIRQSSAWSDADVLVGSANSISGMIYEPLQYWYDPTQQQLHQRDSTNTSWSAVNAFVSDLDPTSMDVLWWNSTTDALQEYDSQQSVWVDVEQFFIQPTDPLAGALVDADAVWVNTTDGLLYAISGPCDVHSVISSSADPRSLPDNTYWHNSATGEWFKRVNGAWAHLDLIAFGADPTNLPLGTYYLQQGALNQWNGSTWVPVMISATSVVPENGTRWYNVAENVQYVWSKGSWIKSDGVISIGTYVDRDYVCDTCVDPDTKLFKYPGLYFYTTATGSDQCIVLEDVNLFKTLGITGLTQPIPGGDGVDAGPMTEQEGVGTDGSGEERRMLQRNIIIMLGGSRVEVELTKEDLDHCIDRAIRELRARGGPYKRYYFPIAVDHQNQREFYLTNKKLNHHRIVRVMGVYRASGLWPSQPDAGVNGFMQPWLYGMTSGVPQGDMVSYHLLASYIDDLNTLLAKRVTYFFNERSRMLLIHNQLAAREPLLIEATVEIAEQDIMVDRLYRNWVERWAVAEAKMVLAQVRGKYASGLPGPTGSTQLNAAELAQEAQAEFEKLIADIDNYVVADLTEYPGSLFAIG